jgi:DNA polymerase sigma
MGENSAKGESILGKFAEKQADFVKDKHLSNIEIIAQLNSLDVDKFKYVYGKAFGYKKIEFDSILEAALMAKTMEGREII